MASRPIYIRNARAASLLEYFFVASAASILLIRAFLALTGYPQLGPGGLHIAHMLYGGAFMTAALILVLSSLGYRALSAAALLGGVGFGFFIDELGKFLTSDNNYFFKPASVIIYLIFVGLFFLIRSVASHRVYSQLEATINSIALLEEVVMHDLDGNEHQRLQHFLRSADQADPLVRSLQAVVTSVPKSALVEHSRYDRWRSDIARRAKRLLDRPDMVRQIAAGYVFQAIISVILVTASVARHYAASNHDAVPVALLAQLGSGLIAFALVMLGGYWIRTNHLKGLEFFRRALLLDLLVTEPFVFYTEQFLAVWGLAFKLALWAIVLYFISAERNETKA